jgi:hypothetical protein
MSEISKSQAQHVIAIFTGSALQGHAVMRNKTVFVFMFTFTRK